MKTYRWSVRLKLGLIVGAGIIAVASLLYTERLVDRLREREQALIQLWADAQAELVQAQQQAINPHLGTLQELEGYLRRLEDNPKAEPPSDAVLNQYQTAVAWAQGMPPTSEANFILNKIIQPNQFRIPAIITDSSGRHPRFWRNVGVPDTLSAPRLDSAEALKQLRARKREMATTFEPIPIRVDLPTTGNPALLDTKPQLTQYLYYDESWLIQQLRIFPWVQLLFVGLFIMVGYFGFSYIRRSEQSSLWMGMAREAAHQLGTPLSSLMGWVQMLRTSDLDEGLVAWVLENLLKNALDAIEDEAGAIRVRGGQADGQVFVEVADTGSGIRRHQWGNVFRPGFSTKQRGWGLGLSLARRVVETYHGGTLELKSSTVGEGSVFRIELPR